MIILTLCKSYAYLIPMRDYLFLGYWLTAELGFYLAAAWLWFAHLMRHAVTAAHYGESAMQWRLR